MGKQSEHAHAREIWAVVLVGLALLLLLSLISYDKFDVGDVAASGVHPLRNFIGPVGAWIAFGTFRTFGLGAYVLMLVLGTIGGMLLLGKEIPWRSKVGAGMLLLLSSSCLLHVAGLERAQRILNLPGSAGGFLGLFVGGYFQGLLGAVGTTIIFVVAYLVSLILLVNLRPSYWVALTVGTVQDTWRRIRGKPKMDVRDELREQERDLRYKEFQVDRELSRKEREAHKLTGGREGEEEGARSRERRPEPKIEDRTIPKPATADEPAKGSTVGEKTASKKEATGVDKPVPAIAAAKPRAEKPVAKPTVALASAEAAEGEQYVLPTLDLLEQPPAMAQRNVIEDLKANAEMLRATLEDFGISVELGDVTKGPTITRYEVYPAPGVKVEKISSLSNNIALAMKAVNVRILTPVPGKGTVGIEVPNTTTTTVYLRDILESQEWRTTKARIPIALGRDVAGNPIISDLSDMPHLLVAGTTGSGKTVCINVILASLLYRFTPVDLRLVLIDPKVVEMQHYNVLPHLIVPVVTEAKKVPLALRWVINEMEKRFQILAKAGVRNIASFNARPKQPPKPKPEQKPAEPETSENSEAAEQEVLKIEVPRDDERVIPDKLPYIVIVIDELADLMLVAPVDVESAIARLAQLARAVGIHMVLATQRPSVDVVTGVIKANFPTRIAFQVASKQDSRVILDANGADKLLGKGDMLYLPPGSSKLIRAQGVLVLDDEIKRIVDFIGSHAKPHFETEIHQKLQKNMVLPADLAEEEDEELVEQAMEVIRQSNRASVSVLQRRLRIGYTRAARIMDVLEERGIVGPNKGAEPREILIDLDGQVNAEP
ncbi:MAG: DNA translocase FtsK [Verrucomicrobiia bacterium]|jgi:S-DNA-T family DNA segregation ATPase FtsK/SpoIIIE